MLFTLTMTSSFTLISHKDAGKHHCYQRAASIWAFPAAFLAVYQWKCCTWRMRSSAGYKSGPAPGSVRQSAEMRLFLCVVVLAIGAGEYTTSTAHTGADLTSGQQRTPPRRAVLWQMGWIIMLVPECATGRILLLLSLLSIGDAPNERIF